MTGTLESRESLNGIPPERVPSLQRDSTPDLLDFFLPLPLHSAESSDSTTMVRTVRRHLVQRGERDRVRFRAGDVGEEDGLWRWLRNSVNAGVRSRRERRRLGPMTDVLRDEAVVIGDEVPECFRVT